jgi:predicted cupin superfamily sugar epimerase
MLTAEQIIELFKMKPLREEGGYYVETYRSPERIAKAGLPVRYGSERNLCTATLYLVTPDAFSRLHRVNSDEVFHFYLGDCVTILELHGDGSSEVVTLGPDIAKGQQVQTVVPYGSWQGCFLNKGGKFALMGTTVAPGFESTDFEAAQREELLKQYPQRRELILKLTQ